MKILCYINHFFGRNAKFEGKSSLSVNVGEADLGHKAKLRKEVVTQAIEQLKKVGNIEVKVCGIEGYSLVPIDISFENIRNNPLLLIYESLNHMARFVDEYDYFINIEDDVLLPEETLANIIEYDRRSMINEVLLPNRLEQPRSGKSYCVDTLAIPGWTQQRGEFNGHKLRVALNPHSAVLVLSKQKFQYVLTKIDPGFRKAILHNELDSAYAYFHSPFALYRSEDLMFHYVVHLDTWLHSPKEHGKLGLWKNRLTSIKINDLVPPIFIRIFSFLRKKEKTS
jgi:hypothetical protein